MRFADLAQTALEALFAHKLRTFLSLLGVIIGVFAVTALVSLGEIATYGIKKGLEQVAGRSVIVQGKLVPGKPRLRFSEADRRLLSSLPAEVVPYVFAGAVAQDEKGKPVAVQVLGVPGDLPQKDPGIELAEGRFFSPVEAGRGAPVAVLSWQLKDRLFKQGRAAGNGLWLRFGPRRARFLVLGATKPLGGLFAGLESPRAYVPFRWLWQHLPGKHRGRYDAFELKVRPGVPLNEVADTTRRLLARRYGADRVQVQSLETFTKTLATITLMLQALLGGIGALSLLVGGIGIMNIMLVSVAERTREIGLRKALGATPTQIRSQFLLEATLLTLTGGLLGVLLAAGVLYLVVAAVPFFEVFILSPKTVLLALGVSAAVGLFFGVWPADQAARLDPIEALRYE